MLCQNYQKKNRRRRDEQGGKVAFRSVRPRLPRFNQVFKLSFFFFSHTRPSLRDAKTPCYFPSFSRCKLLYLLRNPAKYTAVSFPPLAWKGHRVPPRTRKTQTEEGCRRGREVTYSPHQGATARLVEAPHLVFAPRLLIYFSRKLKADAVGASTVGEQCRELFSASDSFTVTVSRGRRLTK